MYVLLSGPGLWFRFVWVAMAGACGDKSADFPRLRTGQNCGPTRVSDAAGDVGEVEPDFDAAEVRALGADGSGDAGAEMAGRADVTGEFGVDFAELGDFVHGGLIDFFLGVEAGAHGPFVEKMEERAGLVETDGLGVGEEIESDFRGDAAVEELIFRGPSVAHGAVVNFFRARIVSEEERRNVVGFAGVGEGEQRA